MHVQDHRALALEHACMWAAYAQENGTPVTADEIMAAARQFAAFLSQPTDVHLVVGDPDPADIDRVQAAVRAATRRRGSTT